MTETHLVTGAAGFIGYHLARRLLSDGQRVIGLDALTDYYDPALKRRRLARLNRLPGFAFVEGAVEAPGLLDDLFAAERPALVWHLAAQAGVRYSIDHPESYLQSNITGSFRLLEAARAHPPRHLMLASTSSVYGANTKMPYAETDKADTPMSFYAATKKAAEAMAHAYAHLYRLPTTMFRFFTVYGAWGRPDMAYFKFARRILAGEPIDIYNHGEMSRDFTYVDDLVEGLVRLASAVPPQADASRGDPVPGDSLSPVAPWRVVNVGNSAPVKLMDFVAALEAALGRKATLNMMEMQPGDVPATWADATLLQALVGALPKTPLEVGLRRFAEWYMLEYHRHALEG